MEHYYFYHDDIKTGLRGEGCGYRKATVRSVGRKWVYIRFSNEETLENFQSKSGKIFADKKILKHGKVMSQKVK